MAAVQRGREAQADALGDDRLVLLHLHARTVDGLVSLARQRHVPDACLVRRARTGPVGNEGPRSVHDVPDLVLSVEADVGDSEVFREGAAFHQAGEPRCPETFMELDLGRVR